jgi:DNA-binding transcriptional LysR family regulator
MLLRSRYASLNNAAMFDWDDLRPFLAVARTGTTLAAARGLGISQPTVVRRIAALEQATGATLFERRRTGYVLTDLGHEIVPLAEAAESAAAAIAEALAARSRHLAGTVRVTAPEPLANAFLGPVAAAFRRNHPDVEVQLLISDEFLDLAKGEADVALRATINGLDNSDLVGRLVATAPWAVYCSRAYAEQSGRPRGIEDLAGHSILGSESAPGAFPAMLWLEETAPEAKVAWRSNSLASLQSAARAGLGLTALPCLLGRTDADLVKCFDAAIAKRPEIWVLAAPAARRRRHIRAFIDALTRHVTAHAEELLDPRDPD